MFRIRLDYSFNRPSDATGEAAHLVNPLFGLLSSIRASGSIRQAADVLGYSYRHVWGELKRWEAELGHELILWEKGRRARLSPFGEKLLWAEERARARIAPQVQSLASELESAFAVAFDDAAHVLTALASHDLALPLLKDRLFERAVHLDLQYGGSLDALAALTAGNCLLAGFHVSDDHPPGSVTARAFKRHLVPGRHKLIDFAGRRQGLMVAPGNPKAIAGLTDLMRPGVRFVNRQPGSGTRVEIEQLFVSHGIDARRVDGYGNEETTHLAVAAAVASGAGDAALGVEAAARQFGLDFLPLLDEDYHLVCLKDALTHPAVLRLREQLASPEWPALLASLPGYAASHSGQVLSLIRALPWWSFRLPRQAGEADAPPHFNP